MELQQNKFNFFTPLSYFEKGVDKQGNLAYKVGGLISDSSIDADGESLDCRGFDFSEFNFINWNHSKAPKDIIGEPEKWKVVPGKGVFMEGSIYPDSEVGRDAIKLMQTLQHSKKGNRLGWSIEGQVEERDIMNPKKVTKAKITAVALCPFPKNGNTFAELIEKGFSGDDIYQNLEDLEYDKVEGGDSYIIDIIDNLGDRILISKSGKIKIVKSQTIDSANILAKEDVEDNQKIDLQKSIITLVQGHRDGLINDDLLTKTLELKKFL